MKNIYFLVLWLQEKSIILNYYSRTKHNLRTIIVVFILFLPDNLWDIFNIILLHMDIFTSHFKYHKLKIWRCCIDNKLPTVTSMLLNPLKLTTSCETHFETCIAFNLPFSIYTYFSSGTGAGDPWALWFSPSPSSPSLMYGLSAKTSSNHSSQIPRTHSLVSEVSSLWKTKTKKIIKAPRS